MVIRHGQVEIGNFIRKIRLEKNLTQEELAERAELSGNYLHEIEVGKRNPSLKIINGIAQSLGVTIDLLVNGQDAYCHLMPITELITNCSPSQLKKIELIISTALDME